MPIYSYKCNGCGHQSDVLQKMSDAPLTICPACGKDSYSKQLTAAGFVLKGGGWYVTDFKDQKGKGQDKKQNTQGEKKSGDNTGKGKNHRENSATTKDNGDKKSVAAEKKNPVKENKVKTTHGSEKKIATP